MNSREDLQVFVERAMGISGRMYMRPVIEKELLHYDIMFALDKAGLLDELTFQGGTALRLCHGAPRFSEDLDFVGGRSFSSEKLSAMKACLENYIGKRYGLEIFVKQPEELAREPEYREVKVDKWQISVITAPDQRRVPKQKIRIEVANIPAYSREPRSLLHNYDFLPDGYSDILIMVETLKEIMADKLVALVNCQTYIRYRDIWDLRWLRQKGADLDFGFISAKIDDYKVTAFPEKAEDMIERLPDIVHGKGFQEQMSRFLPLDVQERTLRKEKFSTFLVNEITRLLNEAKSGVGGN
jgi:predicted nucleotidyltransferase component of viral defense system